MAWTTIDEGRAWAFEYAFNRKGETANACAIKLRDGELLVLSPPCGVTDSDFREIERQGKPVALVAPSRFHHLGLGEWQRRYPGIRTFAPPGAIKGIAGRSKELRAIEPVSAVREILPADVMIQEPPGMRVGDVVARVNTANGAFWYFNDLVLNLRALPPNPIFGALFKWTDSGPGFKVARLLVLFMVKNRPEFKRWLLDEFEKATPVRVITGHGPPIMDSAVAGQLPQMAKAAI